MFLGLGVLLLAVALLLLLLSSGGREGQVEEQVEDDPGKTQKQDRVEQMALPSGPTCGEKALGSLGAGMCCYNWNCF